MGVSEAWVKRIVQSVLRSLRTRKTRVGILLAGNRQIRKLNKKYLSHDYATDVLAFGRLEKGSRIQPGRGEFLFLGDVAVSVEMAKDRAGEFNHSWRYELAFYLCHGILHLAGYDDKTPKDRERMHRKQEQILRRVRTG